MPDETNPSEEGYIVEFISIGNAMKVTAIDPVTFKEVSLIGSPRVPKKKLSALAVRKLKYVLAKQGDERYD